MYNGESFYPFRSSDNIKSSIKSDTYFGCPVLFESTRKSYTYERSDKTE